MADETTKTTDELKDIVRSVFQDELRAEFKADIQQTIEETLKRADVVTQHDVETLVAREIAPWVIKVSELEEINDKFSQMDRKIASMLEKLAGLDSMAGRVSEALARIDGVMTIITGLPDDLERVERHAQNNRNDITALKAETKDAMVGVARLRVDVLGDPTAVVDLSFAGHVMRLLEESERNAQARHAAVLEEIGKLTGVVTEVKAQVATNTIWIENRRRIEQMAIRTMRYSSQAAEYLWERKWRILGGALGGGALVALLDALADPQVQQVIEQFFTSQK